MVHPKNAYLPFWICMELNSTAKCLSLIVNRYVIRICIFKYRYNQVLQIRTSGFHRHCYDCTAYRDRQLCLHEHHAEKEEKGER